MMKLSDFNYTLPEELIALYPTKKRSDSRLLCLNAQGKMAHHKFSNILNFIQPHDILVFNESKVMPARLFGEKPTGGKVEILIERILNKSEALAHVHANRSLKINSLVWLEDGTEIKVIDRQTDLFKLQFLSDQKILTILNRLGHVPLPPYIRREDNLEDKARYQTVYAKALGSVAAPTAGLHFDHALMQQLKEKNIETAFLTLHVGAGTFQPVRSADIMQHHMHGEWIDVSSAVCAKIQHAKAKHGRIIAVGTTSVRSLEMAAKTGELKPYTGETNIFIYPGFKFKIVDAMITNFHLPESTLLMLVSAFVGRENILRAYQEAIKQRYRFYSYGDAMLIEKKL